MTSMTMLIPNKLVLCVTALLLLLVAALKPPHTPPAEFFAEYTLNGNVDVEFFYVDDTNNGVGTHYHYSETDVESFVKGANKVFNQIRLINHTMAMQNFPRNYILTKLLKEQWVHFALMHCKDSIEGMNIAVFGSMEPWVEAAVLAMNASTVTSIEYNNLTYEHPQIRTVAQPQFEELYDCQNSNHQTSSSSSTSPKKFDMALSISSFDHDGLGRYGDPLDPNADIAAMSKVWHVLKPGGLLILTVPIGPDLVVFNLHRRYGKIRLPLLLQHWEVQDRIGWIEEKLSLIANYRQTYEPVFILRKPTEAELDARAKSSNSSGNDIETSSDNSTISTGADDSASVTTASNDTAAGTESVSFTATNYTYEAFANLRCRTVPVAYDANNDTRSGSNSLSVTEPVEHEEL